MNCPTCDKPRHFGRCAKCNTYTPDDADRAPCPGCGMYELNGQGTCPACRTTVTLMEYAEYDTEQLSVADSWTREKIVKKVTRLMRTCGQCGTNHKDFYATSCPACGITNRDLTRGLRATVTTVDCVACKKNFPVTQIDYRGRCMICRNIEGKTPTNPNRIKVNGQYDRPTFDQRLTPDELIQRAVKLVLTGIMGAAEAAQTLERELSRFVPPNEIGTYIKQFYGGIGGRQYRGVNPPQPVADEDWKWLLSPQDWGDLGTPPGPFYGGLGLATDAEMSEAVTKEVAKINKNVQPEKPEKKKKEAPPPEPPRGRVIRWLDDDEPQDPKGETP